MAMTETSFNNGALNTQQSYIPFSFGAVSIKTIGLVTLRLLYLL
jgi:hypothetical protein